MGKKLLLVSQFILMFFILFMNCGQSREEIKPGFYSSMKSKKKYEKKYNIVLSVEKIKKGHKKNICSTKTKNQFTSEALTSVLIDQFKQSRIFRDVVPASMPSHITLQVFIDDENFADNFGGTSKYSLAGRYELNQLDGKNVLSNKITVIAEKTMADKLNSDYRVLLVRIEALVSFNSAIIDDVYNYLKTQKVAGEHLIN